MTCPKSSRKSACFANRLRIPLAAPDQLKISRRGRDDSCHYFGWVFEWLKGVLIRMDHRARHPFRYRRIQCSRLAGGLTTREQGILKPKTNFGGGRNVALLPVRADSQNVIAAAIS